MAERYPESKPMFVVTLPDYKVVFAAWARKWRGGIPGVKLARGGKALGAIYDITEKRLWWPNSHQGYPKTAAVE